MILGIMVDAFCEIDEKRDAVIKDLGESCLFCSIKSLVFDKQGKGFMHHIWKEHSVDHFIFFLYYLGTKEKTEMNGVESWVINCI